eukprot:scaffold10073_cov136-Isochrysis_galbana.AAC.11
MALVPRCLWPFHPHGYHPYSCPMCFNPGLPNPQIFPARSIAEASAQFQVRDPTVEREGPITPIYGPFDCWQNPQSTPPNQPIVMPVHPPHIPSTPPRPPRNVGQPGTEHRYAYI